MAFLSVLIVQWAYTGRFERKLRKGGGTLTGQSPGLGAGTSYEAEQAGGRACRQVGAVGDDRGGEGRVQPRIEQHLDLHRAVEVLEYGGCGADGDRRGASQC